MRDHDCSLASSQTPHSTKALPSPLSSPPHVSTSPPCHPCAAAAQLEKLPSRIGDLRCLRRFQCQRNRIVAIPDEIGRCYMLEDIIAHDNALRKFPASVHALNRARRKSPHRAPIVSWCSATRSRALFSSAPPPFAHRCGVTVDVTFAWAFDRALPMRPHRWWAARRSTYAT